MLRQGISKGRSGDGSDILRAGLEGGNVESSENCRVRGDRRDDRGGQHDRVQQQLGWRGLQQRQQRVERRIVGLR
jgi:hypothetical protein